MDNYPNYDLSYLRTISGDDEAFVLDMVKTFISEAKESVRQLREHYDDGNFIMLKETAHKFITTVTYVGAKYLHDKLESIEDFASHEKNINEIPGLIDEIDIACIKIADALKKDFNTV